MKFTKMHGCGNDYVYIKGEDWTGEDKKALIPLISDRHFGVGSDGVIFINSSDKADFEMEMYNADGSRSQMCGNGIRCVGKFVYDKGMTDKKEITVESFGAVKYLTLLEENGEVNRIKVDMGAPELKADKVPVVCEKENAIMEPVKVGEKTYHMTCVSMGNPHAVIFVDEITDDMVWKDGAYLETAECFPERANIEFIKVVDRNHIIMRVWERGSGETYACGTGSCASVVAAVINGLTDEKVKVSLVGGDLEVEYNRQENKVYMTGPAQTVFEGELDTKKLK